MDLQLTLHGFYINSRNEGETKENENIQKSNLQLESENQNNDKSIKLKTINIKANSALAASKRQTENNNEEYVFADTSENNYSKAYYFIDSNSERIIERIPAAAWKSTTILAQLLKETLEDLINENGVVYKTMINAYIENKEKEKISALIKDESIKETNRRQEIKNDPIVLLIEKLESCNNRSERKRLLAQFNKTVGFGWGEYRKIPKFEDNDFDKNYEDDLNNEDADNNNNNDNSSNNSKEIYRQIADESKRKNSNNYNTIVYNENKVKKIYSDSQKVNLIGSKFMQKINVKNQKYKALVNQKTLSLMLNDESADRTYVKIPGKDYEKAISYIGEDNEEKVKNFENLIEAKKKDYSVNLRNYVKSKQGKTDKLIDKSKKITLLQLEKLEERKMLEKDELNKESIMLDFEMKVGRNNLLENKFSKNNFIVQHSNNSIEFADNKNLLVFQEEENNLALQSNENKKYDLNAIQFKKLNLRNKSEFKDAEANMALYRQENEITKNNIKVNQDKAKIKKVLKNKHIYQSMNYYKNNDLEHLAYERDPDVMNALRFKNVIKKDKYYNDRDRQLHNKNLDNNKTNQD